MPPISQNQIASFGGGFESGPRNSNNGFPGALGMRVHVQGGSIKLVVPIPEPEQNITWLKNDFKLRALRRGKDLTVTELTWNGSLLDDDDKICDVVDNFAQLTAAGPGIESITPKVNSGIDQNGVDTRTKRKYTRGGHKKLKLVAPILESYLSEMSTTSEKERQKFYAKIVSLPQMVAAEVNRDEVVSWYKRARKKTRTCDEPSDGQTNNRSNHHHHSNSNSQLNDQTSLMNGIMSLDNNSLMQNHHQSSSNSLINDNNNMLGGLDMNNHLVNPGLHHGLMNTDMNNLHNQRLGGVPPLEQSGIGSLDLHPSLQNGTIQRSVSVREMAPEELAYAEPSSQAAYAAAMAQQGSQSLPQQQPMVAPVAATQPVVGL